MNTNTLQFHTRWLGVFGELSVGICVGCSAESTAEL